MRSPVALGCLLLVASALTLGCTHDIEGQGPIKTETESNLPRAAVGEACECVSSADDPKGDEACCAVGLVCRSEAPATCSTAGCSRAGVCVARD